MSSDPPPRLRKAVLPAAGAARRLHPLTLAVPKPLLPLGLRPLLEYALVEAEAAGFEAAAVVVSPEMRSAVSRYLAARPGPLAVAVVLQEEPRGLADAILAARPWLAGEGCAVLNPDSLYVAGEPVLSRLVRVAGRRPEAAVPLFDLSLPGNQGVAGAGRVEVEPGPGELWPVRAVLPKERGRTMAELGARWKLGGRYLLRPDHLDDLAAARPAAGEHDDTPSLMAWARAGRLVGVPVAARILDCGLAAGYLAAWEVRLGSPPSWWP